MPSKVAFSCNPRELGPGLQLLHAEENLLDRLLASGSIGGHPPSIVVGHRRDHPNRFHCMVGRVPQRLVLAKHRPKDAAAQVVFLQF